MMKKVVIIALGAFGFLASCDHVDNPYPPAISQGDWDLYPNGDSAHYYQNVFQEWEANTNTDRNVLIEDFTGHLCVFCPPAGVVADDIKNANPGRVFVEANHTGPDGLGNLQETDPPIYVEDFTCQEGLDIGIYFGIDWPNSNFFGNPSGTVNRIDDGSGQIVRHHSTWANETANILSANDLKVNMQAQMNYYPSTRGLIAHVEIEELQTIGNELRIVSHLIEDSKVAPQAFQGMDSLTYEHKDVLRGSLDGLSFGQLLDADHLDQNGKYYYDYLYELPAGYDPSNMSIIFYVRDAVTEEIYQVIEKHVM